MEAISSACSACMSATNRRWSARYPTLVAHVGGSSPLFRMLAPEEASGVLVQIDRTVAEALRAQSEQVLQQFSVDRKDSALSRLVAELTAAHDAASSNMQQQVKAVVGEFSLDRALRCHGW
jgi:hypothetical protein